MPRTRAGKRTGADAAPVEQDAQAEHVESAATAERNGSDVVEGTPKDPAGDGEGISSSGAKVTMAERMAKLKELRQKMAESTKANRKAVATETNKHKSAKRTDAINARKLEKAERTLDERDAMERGNDPERLRSWTYTIEDNERWDEKLEQKEAKKDQGNTDQHSASERTYRRLVSQIKPDIKASGSGSSKNGSGGAATSSALTSTAAPSSDVSQFDSQTSLRYGMHKPDDAALDRVASYLNAEADVRAKRSRHRADDPDAEVNYINDSNKHFNKKIKRYYDQHTVTIRENFERGTAL